MHVSVENTSAIARRLTIEIPASEIQSQMSKRLTATISKTKVNGFRPGKVSKATEKRYENSILQDIMWENLEEALKEQKITPAGRPTSIEPEEFTRGKDFRYIVDLDIFPAEFELADNSDIEVIRPVHELTDADVEEMITALRKQASTFNEVEREAKEDDRITIDFIGKLDGEPFEGGTAKQQPILLGSKQMIPGFEEALIGAKKGEERTFKVTFPEDYQAENLAGKEVEFTVNILKVEEMHLAAMDEDLFKRYGMTEGDADKFTVEVRKNMQRELTQAIKTKIKNQVLSALIKKNPLEVPRAWIEDEAIGLRNQSIEQMNAQYGVQLKPDDFPTDRFLVKAKNRVLLGMIVRKFIEQAQLKADENRVNKMIEDIAAVYENPEEVIKQMKEDQQGLEGIRSVVLEDQVIDLILEQAKVTDEVETYQEVVRANEKFKLDV